MFQSTECRVFIRDEILCMARLEHGLYHVRTHGWHEFSFLTGEKSDGELLWYNRFGHSDFTMLRNMV